MVLTELVSWSLKADNPIEKKSKNKSIWQSLPSGRGNYDVILCCPVFVVLGSISEFCLRWQPVHTINPLHVVLVQTQHVRQHTLTEHYPGSVYWTNLCRRMLLVILLGWQIIDGIWSFSVWHIYYLYCDAAPTLKLN